MSKWCLSCQFENRNGSEVPCTYCINNGNAIPSEYKPNKPNKPKTNADYIRAMTDEELAEWLGLKVSACNGNEKCGNDYTCDACWLEWLKQDYITFVAQEYKKDLNDRLNREGISP